MDSAGKLGRGRGATPNNALVEGAVAEDCSAEGGGDGGEEQREEGAKDDEEKRWLNVVGAAQAAEYAGDADNAKNAEEAEGAMTKAAALEWAGPCKDRSREPGDSAGNDKDEKNKEGLLLSLSLEKGSG